MKSPVYAISLILAGILGISGTSSAMSSLGTPIHDDDRAARRTIVIDSNTRSVYVFEDQTVKFVVKTAQGEKQFSWKFNTLHSRINLNDVAPDGILNNASITAYVASDPDGIFW